MTESGPDPDIVECRPAFYLRRHASCYVPLASRKPAATSSVTQGTSSISVGTQILPVAWRERRSRCLSLSLLMMARVVLLESVDACWQRPHQVPFPTSTRA